MSFHKKPFIYLFILIYLFLFTAWHCGSAPIKDKDGLEKIHEQAEKGDKKSYDNYEKALEKANEENNPELKEMIIKDLASIPTNESRALLKKEAESESSDTKTMALNGLYEQSKTSDNPEVIKAIKEDTVDIIKNNAEKNNGLTSNEIQILGEVKDDKSEDLLIEELNREPKNDENQNTDIVKSLSKILADRKKEVEKSGTLESPDLNQKSKLEFSFQNIESALLNLIKSGASNSLKETTLIELYNAYIPDSRKKFIEMYNSNEYSEETKLAILKVLGYQENSENNEIIKSLKKEFLSTEDPEEHTRIFNRIGALTPKEFRFIKAELEKEMQKILRRRELKALAAKGQLSMLKIILKKYNVSNGTVDKIQASTQELALDKTTPMKAEAVILFSSVQEIYRDKNFFEIKKTAQNGLHIPGLFLIMLSSIDKDFASYDMKILTIQSVWKIDEVEATKIYKAYQSEKELLRELLH